MSEKSSEEQIKPQGWLGLVLVRANTGDKIRLESWAVLGQATLQQAPSDQAQLQADQET